MSATGNRRAASILLAGCLAACLAGLGAGMPAWSQTLTDPTVPPPEARLGAGPAAAVSASGPRLQSVLLGNQGRRVAVIDGQSLQVGDKIHGATLVAVERDRVVLQHGRARQVLKLFPDARAGAPLPAAATVPAPVNSANK